MNKNSYHIYAKKVFPFSTHGYVNLKISLLTLVLLCLLFLVFSCSKKQQKITTTILTYDLNKVETDAKSEAKIKDIRYIALETNDESLMGFPSKIIYRFNKFYILDCQSKSLFVFDSNGKFISKIHRLGKGPGEYINNSDFDIDNAGNIYIWDSGTHKLIKYASNGVMIKEYSFTKYVFINFLVLPENKLLLHTIFEGGNTKYTAGIFDLETNSFENLLTAKEKYEDYNVLRNSFSYLFPSKSAIYYTSIYSADIYKFDSVQNKKIISFNTTSIPSISELDFINKNGQYSITNDYFKCINDVYETEEHLVFEIMHFKQLYFMIQNKKTGKLITTYGLFDKRLFNYGVVRGTTGDEFISPLLPDFFSRKNWKSMVMETNISANDKDVLLKQTSNSNCVLMLYKLDN